MWGRIKKFFRARRLKSTVAGLDKLSANDAHKLKEWLQNDHVEDRTGEPEKADAKTGAETGRNKE
ncbi:hypothetical protein CW354_17650 [Marinicaulis flavus]|uniref:Uncharacterized protein n=1 Tax=Hyphococcus luteus TaxID=2058213 RepID=A0A2S7K147_9PROT|nr:hypothetical protein CW354_17650 [Marinicaulis flavus]